MKKIIGKDRLDKIVGGFVVPKKPRFKVGKRSHKRVVFPIKAPPIVIAE